MKGKPTILIVDDEIRNIELQKAYLEPYNYGILTALNGEEALHSSVYNREF
jgi:CheY-like chemotaxis protein